MLTEAELAREAAGSGFGSDTLEKAIRLLELLDSLRGHPFLKPRIALKGGTALNLFVFDVPRLSVDVDLNYVGTSDVETMRSDRPKMEQAIDAVCGRLGIQVRRVPSDHAGGKWRLSYAGVSGRPGTLELDVNFMFRTPLWPYAALDSRPVASFQARQVPVLDLHELAAGKLAALFSRNASRDVFDARELLIRGGLDRSRLRTAFLVYGGVNRRDWRTVSLDDVKADPRQVDRELLPVLRLGVAPAREQLVAWTDRIVAECRDRLSLVLPFEANELEFLDRLNERGEIVPELVTDKPDLQANIESHPGLRWKAINVRSLRGVERHDRSR
ncbi:MAG: nucleotidyl transferase AbiEii/AbiGii toxin family protein [Gemmatimonadales bacterium]|jgi:predicted nucleotidyltransferase component of viral defense system